MLTSRAEHRLLLREDNATERLSDRGRALGLLPEAAWVVQARDSARVHAELEGLRPADGRGRLGADDARPALLDHAHYDAAAGVVRVRVSDTGRGIAPEQLERIFDPFVQVDRRRTHESQQGVGLGLAISRDLARGMGGDLVAASAPDGGSAFTLTLPGANG